MRYRKIIAFVLSMAMILGMLCGMEGTLQVAAKESAQKQDENHAGNMLPLKGKVTAQPSSQSGVTAQPSSHPGVTALPSSQPAETVPPANQAGDALEVQIHSNKAYITVGSKITLSVSGLKSQDVVEYSWYRDGTLLDTTKTDSYTTKIRSKGVGKYSCKATLVGASVLSSSSISVIAYSSAVTAKAGKTVKASRFFGNASKQVQSIIIAKQPKKYKKYIKINSKKHSIKIKKYCPKVIVMKVKLKDKSKLTVKLQTLSNASTSLKFIRNKTALQVNVKHAAGVSQIKLGKEKKAIVTMQKNSNQENYIAIVNNGRKITTKGYYIQYVYQTPEFGKGKTKWVKVKVK